MNDWSDIYWEYADEDFEIAKVLLNKNRRLCVYHIGQSLEKYLKSTLARRLNLDQYNVQKFFVRDHKIEEIIKRICSIYGAPMGVSELYLRNQVHTYIPTFLKIKLHNFNRVRYPKWDTKKRTPRSWEFTHKDCKNLISELENLRNWLTALPR